MADSFFRLDGRVAIVTGGGQGIGEAICRRLAAAGAHVGIFDREAGQGERVARDIAGISLPGDVTSEADIESSLDEIHERFGPVDILVNNAGITGKAAKIWDLTRKDLDTVMEVNVTGPWMFCRAVLQDMTAKKYGRIVNVASIAGKEGNPTLGPYSASKSALIALTKSIAKEVIGLGDITVNAISPAVIATPMVEALPQATVDYMVSKIPMGRTGTPEEVAALVHFLASKDASFTTGQCYDISGGRATY